MCSTPSHRSSTRRGPYSSSSKQSMSMPHTGLVLVPLAWDAPHWPCARAPCMGCLLWNGVGDEAWHVKDRHGQIRDRLLCLGCTRTRAHLPCNMRTLARYHDQGVARRGVELLVSRLTHAGDWASAPVNLVSWQSSVYIRVLPPLHTPSTPPHPHPPPFFH